MSVEGLDGCDNTVGKLGRIRIDLHGPPGHCRNLRCLEALANVVDMYGRVAAIQETHEETQWGTSTKECVNMGEMRETITQLHRRLFNELVMRAQTLEDEQSQTSLDEMVGFLQNDLITHIRDEGHNLYPIVEPLILAHGRATAGMDMDHSYIEQYIQRIATIAQEAKTADPGQQARLWQSVRDLFVRMEAVLEVHLGKEEALLVPLFEKYLPIDEQQRVVEEMLQAHGQR